MSNQDFIIPVVVGPLVGVVLYLLRRNVRAVAPVINENAA